MTRLDLQTRLQNHFNNPTYYTVEDMNNSIQDGLDEICAFSGCILKSTTLTFTQFTSYYDMLTLIPDYIGVYAIFNSTIRRFLYPQSLKKFNDVRIDWDNAYGTPYYFSPINHRYVAIYMKPSVPDYGSMVVFYLAQGPQLSDSTVIPIPDEHLLVLESYSKADLWEQSQEFSKGAQEFQNYTGTLEKLRELVQNQRNSDRKKGLML
jgi:hypothetical protein